MASGFHIRAVATVADTEVMSFIWEFGGFTVYFLFLFTDLQGIFSTLISETLYLNLTDFRPTINFKKQISISSCDVEKTV